MSKGRPKKTHAQYLQEVKYWFGPKVKVLDEYVDSRTKLRHLCTTHNYIWSRYPTFSTYVSGPPGCLYCRRDQGVSCKIPTESFATALHKVSPNLKVLSYSRTDEKACIVCTLHKVKFEAWPNNLLSGSGCPECAREKAAGTRNKVSRTLPHKEFLEKLHALHGKSIELLSKYLGYGKPLTVRYTACGHIKTYKRAGRMLDSAHCGQCLPRSNYSKAAIAWIQEEAKRRRLKGIRHAENGGEFRIPGTPFKVDGYHERTKTVFEYYGDAFHGNPNKYKPRDRPNPWSTKTARKLYLETLAREEVLKSLGYRVISIFEGDYHARSN